MSFFDEVGEFLGMSKKEEPLIVVKPVVEIEPVGSEEPLVEPEPELGPELEPGIEPEEPVEPIVKPVAELEPEPEDELTLSKKQNEALLARINALEGKPAEVKPVELQAQPEVSFLGDDDDIDSFLNDKAKLNGLLLKVYNRALTDAGAQFNGNVPSVVVDQIQRHMVLKEGIDEFFGANKDLLPVRKTVGAITNEIVSEHGEWTLKQVLVEAEKRTRETLGIKKPVGVKRERNPALVDKGSSRQKVKDLRNDVQKDIDDLIA